MIKPPYPDHPTATVLKAGIAGTNRAKWVCVVCGKKLGETDREEPKWEPFIIK